TDTEYQVLTTEYRISIGGIPLVPHSSFLVPRSIKTAKPTGTPRGLEPGGRDQGSKDILHAEVHALADPGRGPEQHRGMWPLAGGEGKRRIDLVAGADHAAEVQDIVADPNAQMIGHVETELEFRLGGDGERVAREFADVAVFRVQGQVRI